MNAVRIKLNMVLVFIISVLVSVGAVTPAYAAPTFDTDSLDYIGDHYGHVYITDSITQGDLDMMCSSIDRLPQTVRDALAANNVDLILFNLGELTMYDPKWEGQANYPGFIYYYDDDGNVMSIERDEDNLPYQIAVSAGGNNSGNGLFTVHEIGHIIDVTYAGGPEANKRLYGASDTPGFAAIAAAEKNSLATVSETSSLNVYSDQEIFAEAFGCFYTYPDIMLERCPMLSAYIVETVNTYNSRTQDAPAQAVTIGTADNAAITAELAVTAPEPAEQAEPETVTEQAPVQGSDEPKDETDALSRRRSETIVLSSGGYEIRKARPVITAHKPVAENNKDVVAISYTVIEKPVEKTAWYVRLMNWMDKIRRELTGNYYTE